MNRLLISLFLQLLMPAFVMAELHTIPPPIPKNNLSECTPNIRSRAGSAKDQWGPFEVDCVGGAIVSVYASTGSAIAKNCWEFVDANRALFGMDEGSLSAQPHLNPFEDYYWHGVRVLAKRIYCDANNSMVSNFPRYRIFADIPDTSQWKINPTPKISSSAAVELTAQLIGGIGAGKSIEVSSSDLVIAPEEVPPLLAWSTFGWAYSGDTFWDYWCIIDARGGAKSKGTHCKKELLDRGRVEPDDYSRWIQQN
jgi:hypothetical protein